jgi:hypothetical protein
MTDGIGIHTWVIPSLHMVVTRSGEPGMNALPALASGDVDHVVPGHVAGPGEHEFFRLLMGAVTDMPASVRKTIKNSGRYSRRPQFGVDARQFTLPLSTVPGSYLALGPGKPVHCAPTPLGCAGAPNNGYLDYLTDAPRVIPGTLGKEKRPTG